MFGEIFWLFCSHLLYTQVNVLLRGTATSLSLGTVGLVTEGLYH